MAIKFRDFAYGPGGSQRSPMDIGGAMRQNFGGGNLFRNIMSVAGSGGRINPMGMLGFGPVMRYDSQSAGGPINQAYGGTGSSGSVMSPQGDMTLYSGEGTENPVYIDGAGELWIRRTASDGVTRWIPIGSADPGSMPGGDGVRGGRQGTPDPPQPRTR